jgi:hypothetical protein
VWFTWVLTTVCLFWAFTNSDFALCLGGAGAFWNMFVAVRRTRFVLEIVNAKITSVGIHYFSVSTLHSLQFTILQLKAAMKTR